MDVIAQHDPETGTISYIVADTVSRRCAIIDSVLDFDPKAARTSTGSADALIRTVRDRGLTCDWLLETHVHADHLSAANYLRQHLGGRIGIGQFVATIQTVFSTVYGLGSGFATDGRQFDHLFMDGEQFHIGGVHARVMHTPGHTPACLTYVIEDAAFAGDTLFMPDAGSARCDFPGGDAATLYHSIQRILALPPDTRIFTGHDYGPGGRPPRWEATVAEHRAHNIHIHDGVSEQEFVAMRIARDRTLAMPTLILPAVQVNICAGELPEADASGRRYLKIPLNAV